MKSLLSNSTLHRTLICSLLRDGTYFALKGRQNCWYQLYLKLELKHKETFRTSLLEIAAKLGVVSFKLLDRSRIQQGNNAVK